MNPHENIRCGVLCRSLVAILSIALSTQGYTQQLLISDVPPADVIGYYKKRDPASAQDFFTLALAYFANFQFRESVDLANQAIGRFSDSEQREKALCFQLISNSYGALGEYALAAKAATNGQRLDPASKELAALRFGYYQKSGDKVNELIAKDNLMFLDPQHGKTPKCDPITIGIVVTGAVAVYVIYRLHNEKDPQVRREFADILSNLTKLGVALAMIAANSAASASKSSR